MGFLTIGEKSGLFAEVSHKGAMVHSLFDHKNGARVLYPFFAREDGKERGGCPICFPAFGSPVPVYTGENQHGWLRDERVVMNEFDGIVNAIGSRRAGGLYGTKNVVFNVIHSIYESSILSRLRFFVEDIVTGGGNVLFRPGFHPYFPNDGATVLSVDGKEYTNFSEKAQCIRICNESQVIISTGKLTIEMGLHGFFGSTCLYLWSDAPDEYFCVEPVFSTREDFLNGDYLNAVSGTLYDIAMELDVID